MSAELTSAQAPDRQVLIFLNEVAGGRMLLEAVRQRRDRGVESFSVVAPQNQPLAGQIVDRANLRDAAQSRVDVTVSVLREFGIEAAGEVMDPHPPLALADAVRAYAPTEILLSCMAETRFGLLRRDLVEWALDNLDPPIVHIPVRIEDDAVRWDVTHTLVVATQTVASGDLLAHLKQRAAERPHRYTIVCPRSGALSREEVCERLSRTLAELYRAEIDATGQPMSPDPFAAVQNALEHYRVDEVLISTFAGEASKWLEEDLVGRVRAATNKPVEHLEAGLEAGVPAGAAG